MNGRKARRLRKEVQKSYIANYGNTYFTGNPASWGPLPRNKVTGIVDKKRFKKLLNEIKNIKFSTIRSTNKYGAMVLEKVMRYIPGSPTVLKLGCWRKQYQLVKRNYVEVAQG